MASNESSSTTSALDALRIGDAMKKGEEDEEDDVGPFATLDKGTVLQEARVFNEAQLDVRRCQQILTKLLYLLNQGEQFTKKEATEVFFSTTKLFQSHDLNLRRMVYLMIKEMSPSSDKVIIVTNPLMKDMSGKSEAHRANAIRVLCRITDANLLQQIERYMKQAVVDKSPMVASAALVSGIHLFKQSPDAVRRWSSEVQEVVHSRNPNVQFHALALLHLIRQNDRLAVNKLVTQLTQNGVRSPLAQCLLVRYVSHVMGDGSAGEGKERPFYSFLETCLRNKSEMVILESARAIVNMKNVTSQELQPAVSVLQLFLSSSKPALRFAAVRTLNKVAGTHPMAVSVCSYELEDLAQGDPNRSVATMAINTVLKLANESNVDRIVKLATECVPNIQDDFRIVVVDAIHQLCLKLPHKYSTLLHFLSTMLREEGGFEYKKAIVDAVFALMRRIPESRELALSHLCEFIEDCEYPFLSCQVLHVIGSEGPSTKDPSKYLRYVYNRIILEGPTVRSAAVSALAKLGVGCDAIRSRVIVLLKRCLYDNDDEVRDRATFDVSILESEKGTKTEEGRRLISTPPLSCNPEELERRLASYLEHTTEEPFDITSVPVEPPKPPSPSASKEPVPSRGQSEGVTQGAPPQPTNQVTSLSQVSSAPELKSLGNVFKSSPPVQLTEEETEYRVTCVKHVLEDGRIVFQFACENTVPEQELEKVSVLMESDEGTLEEEFTVQLDHMPHDGQGAGLVFVCMRPSTTGGMIAASRLVNTLRFKVREVDPTTGEPEEEGYADEYQLEDVDVTFADYVKPLHPSPSFRSAWESLPEDTERVDDYGLGSRQGLQEALEAVVSALGLTPCDGTDAVPPTARSHTAILAGEVIGGNKVLVRLQLGLDGSGNVAMKLAARSDDPSTSNVMHEIVASS